MLLLSKSNDSRGILTPSKTDVGADTEEGFLIRLESLRLGAEKIRVFLSINSICILSKGQSTSPWSSRKAMRERVTEPAGFDFGAGVLSTTESEFTPRILLILQGVHARLVSVLRDMSVQEFSRKYTHPEHGKSLDLAFTVGMYSWHGRHHLAHIKSALKFQRAFWN